MTPAMWAMLESFSGSPDFIMLYRSCSRAGDSHNRTSSTVGAWATRRSSIGCLIEGCAQSAPDGFGPGSIEETPQHFPEV